MACDIQNIDFNPSLVINPYKINDNITVNVIDDGKLLGGTKQRALIRFIDYYSDYDEFVYAGPSTGFAQVALTMAGIKRSKKITLFIQNNSDYLPNLTFWCQKSGANVYIYYDKLSNIEAAAKYYVEIKEVKPFLIPFGLESPIYTNFLYEELSKVIHPEINPKRLWLVVGSGTLLKVLARIWDKTEFFPVQVGKQIWEDQYDPEVWKRMGGRERIDKLKAPQKFFDPVYGKNLPPYASVANYDAKVWQQVVKYAENGDYIWNVASDSGIFKCYDDNNHIYKFPTFDSIISKNMYSIKSSQYLDNDDGDKYINGARELIPLVKNNTIWFPYHRYTSFPPMILFNNLLNSNLKISHDKYKLKSYFPPNGFYFPPLFRNKPTTIINNKNDFNNADVLSDYFIEEIRLKSKRYDQIHSILQCWEIDNCLEIILAAALKTKEYITPLTLRDAIYEKIQETGTFSPIRARALVKIVLGENTKNKKWLDISSGWGDRLLAAISLDMIYTGFDPNIELKKGHDEIIEFFGDNSKQRIYYEPFEKANIVDGPYDIILTSPPFFDVEKYSVGQKGQSISNYPDFNDWLVNFLFASLIKAWNNLKEGGFLMLHIGDTVMLNFSEATNMFIENNLPGASWEGVIGISGESENYRPVWCYKKLSRYGNIPNPLGPVQGATLLLQKWKTNKITNPRTLYYYYPEIQKELIKFYSTTFLVADKIYEINNNEIITVKNKLYEYYPSHLEEINNLFEDLVLSSIINELGIDNSIKWCVAMIKLSLFD
jgi:hypothetical protein